MATNSETRMSALEQQLGDALARLAELERHSPEVQAARKLAAQRALAAKVASITTMAEFKALNSTARAMYMSRATAASVTQLVRGASADDRKLVLASVRPGVAAEVIHALAPAPKLVRVESTVGFTTAPVMLGEDLAEQLAEAGCDVSGRVGVDTWQLMPTVMDPHDVVFYELAHWEALLSADPLLGRLVETKRVLATRLSDDDARIEAWRRYAAKLDHARDLGRSDLMPSLPSL